MMKRGFIWISCLMLCLSLIAQAAGDVQSSEPYWGYCNKSFASVAMQHAEGIFPGGLSEHRVVQVVGGEGGMLEVIAFMASGEQRKAWFWKDDISESADKDWHKPLFVSNPDPQDRLNLRQKPDKGSLSFGKYYNGTAPVALGPSKKGWTKVSIGGRKGYMQTKYLLDISGGRPPASPVRTLTIASEGGRGARLKETPWMGAANFGEYPSGEEVWLLGVEGDWCHVELRNGFSGFMPASSFPGQIE